jgi:dipeptidyl aminopeptidase/acylaminoacyl peptidase
VNPSAPRYRRQLTVLALAIAVVFGLTTAGPGAQTPAKKALTVDDYTKWRSINSSELSPDGKWVVYGVAQTNTTPAESKPVLHLLNLETSQDVEVPNASAGAFSSDSRWLAYQVDPSTAGRGGRGGRGGGGGAGGGAPAVTPPNPVPAVEGQTPAPGGQAGRGATTPPAEPRRVELRNLQTGAVKAWQDIATFTFSANARHLMLRRRPPQAAGGAGRGGDTAAPAPGGAAPAAAAAPSGPRGVDVTIHNLATGRDQLLGSVGDISFNKSGDLIAYTVDAAVKDTNGLFVLDLRNGRLSPLDNDAKIYNRLTWNDAGTAVAVLKGVDVEKKRERTNVLMTYPDVQAALGDAAEPPPVVLDPAKADNFPKDWVISDRAGLTWSEDNKRVFFGMKEQVATPDARRNNTDENADVDVWRWNDERIQSQQMIRADADRNFTFREGFDIPTGKFVKLADDTMRELDIAADGRWAVGRDVRGYIHDYKRPAADFYRVNTTTGERTLMFKNQLTGSGSFGISPDGRSFLYWKDNKFQVYVLDTAATRPLGAATTTSFIDTEYDHPGPKPSFGIAGYTADGRSVIVQHRFDLWVMPLDGSAPRNLTNGLGAKNEMRFRFVRTVPGDPQTESRLARTTIDLSKPVILSAYGEYTKKSGYYELANGQLRELIYEDASFSTPQRALKGDVYLFTRQTFVEYPDLRISGPGFKDSKKITNINPQQSEYLWGKRVLFDFKNKDGMRLQGILALPDDYKPGEKRPMIVTFYEKNSQNMHRYSSPSYVTGMGAVPMQATTEGYITMLPDVYFHTGSSHSDMLECVEAAVRRVIEMGYVDPKRIGINGHSYGGEGAAFIGTRSRLFAAVGMGAGVTDLYTDFSQSWGWSYQVTGGSGANGNDYYLYGQGRWGFSPWEKPDVYHFESAITHAPEATAPFLIMHGTADPTVSFAEGMNFYNALRYNNKVAYMLAYPGEGHGLRGLANRKDLTIRYFEFFNHYLKDAPAPKWMTEGVPFIKKGS